MEKIKLDDSLLERIAIIIEIVMVITNCSYSDAYELVTNTRTYKFLTIKDYSTIHDSPQANLSSMGNDLRRINNPIGNKITDENIKQAMRILREQSKNTK